MSSAETVLEQLSNGLANLTPEIHKAATYVLENPNEVGVCSIREIATAAQVKPNTFVRMARNFGFDGYDDFRSPFRDHLRKGVASFPDQARWLQSLSKQGDLGEIFASMAANAIENIENTFAATNADKLKAAADAIINARRTYVLGVGINHALAHNFAYLADMALDNIEAIPRNGSLAVDDIARAGERDVLVAITFKPYRNEVVETVNVARQQGVTIIGISDSPAAPVMSEGDHRFVVQTDTAQFFTSTIATGALLETLMAFAIADASSTVVNNIRDFHDRRHDLGIYYSTSGE